MSYNCVNVKVICVYPCQCQISVSMLRSSLSINVKVNYLCEWQWVFFFRTSTTLKPRLMTITQFCKFSVLLKKWNSSPILHYQNGSKFKKRNTFCMISDSSEDIKLTKCEYKQTQVILEIWMHVSLCLLRQFNLRLYFWAAIALPL